MEKKTFPVWIVSFFIFATLFPTMRLLIIGRESSTNLLQYTFSILPDLFAIAVLAVVFSNFRHRWFEIKLKALDWIILIFFVTNVVIGFFIANDFFISVYGFRSTYFPVLFYFIFRFGPFEITQNILKKIFLWFLMIGIAGIILFFFFNDQMIYMLGLNQAIPAEYFIIRMTSIFWTPVVFSTFMGITFIYFCFQYLLSGKWYFLAGMAILVFCILMSVSRGAMIASSVTYVFLIFLNRNWKRTLFTAITIIAVYFFTSIYIASPGELFQWLANSTINTLSLKKDVSRAELWYKAFENFKTHPFGFGLGKAGHVALRFYGDGSTEADVFSTDGWFLKIANETGIWGICSYLFFSFFYFFSLLKSKILKNRDTYLILFFCIFIMVNIQNFVSNVLDFYLFPFIFWAIIGASTKLFTENKPS